MKTDLDYAREVWAERSNGACEGISPGKGGRAWLSGEFQLEELEALCIILKDVAGIMPRHLGWQRLDSWTLNVTS